ncbi:MAG: tRNA lysidine(34) synthetase TilS [Anaerolineae bacterium]
MDLQPQIDAFCQQHTLIAPGDKIVVGVSGGADSLCLLAVLNKMAPAYTLKLHVAHLHHGLRGRAADEDADFVAGLAQKWGLSATIGKEDVAAIAQKQKLSLEAAARQARYTFLAHVAHFLNAPKIAVAHNANDQAETVLLRFLRGSGVTGLRGMLPATPLADYIPATAAGKTPLSAPRTLIRPLLDTPRADIEAYCRAHALTPRLDASNRERAFLRNRVRHELLPLLKTYNPNIVATIQRTASLMAADSETLQKEVERTWRFVVHSKTARAITFDRNDWQVLSLGMQRQILRRAIQALRRSLKTIEFAHIDRAIGMLAQGNTGSRLDLPHNLRLSLDYHTFTLANRSYTSPLPNIPHFKPGDDVPLKIPGITVLPGSRWYLHTTLAVKNSISSTALKEGHPWRAYFDAGVVGQNPIVRSRRPGDSFYPFGLKGHRQRLKAFMINQKIPAAQRAHIPLLVSEGGQICWVCGWRTDHRSRVTPKTETILVVELKQKLQKPRRA